MAPETTRAYIRLPDDHPTSGLFQRVTLEENVQHVPQREGCTRPRERHRMCSFIRSGRSVGSIAVLLTLAACSGDVQDSDDEPGEGITDAGGSGGTNEPDEGGGSGGGQAAPDAEAPAGGAGMGPDAGTANPPPVIPADSGAPPRPQGPFSCTTILTGTPTRDWFIDGLFDGLVPADRYQLQGGTGIRHWAAADDAIWKGNPSHRCAQDSAKPGRAILVMWSHDNLKVDAWEEQIREAIATIRLKLPSVELIALEPEAGNPKCSAHSGRNYDAILTAIGRVIESQNAATGALVAGARVSIADCSAFSGNLDEMSEAALRDAAKQRGTHYAKHP